MADPSSPIRATPGQGGRDSTEAQRADEPERSDGNPNKKSRFMRYAESTTQKEKILTGKFYSPKSGFAFCRDFLTSLGKRQKKWRRERDSNPRLFSL